jgi:hypothetical protein
MKLFVIASLFAMTSIVSAQTFNDPVPIQGNMVTETARGIAMQSAFSPSTGARRTPEQSARRSADLDANRACRDRAMQYPAGHKMRRSIRDQCSAQLKLARTTWHQ